MSQQQEHKTKHLINCLESSVWENLIGFAKCHDNVQAVHGINTLIRSDYIDNVLKKQQVAILSGAGSGHEPMQAGFVGPGGITASVSGHIFSSPTTTQVLKAIRLLGSNSPAGVLITIMYVLFCKAL